MTHSAPQKPRSVARRLVAALSLGILATALLPVTAFADTPDTWTDAPEVSGLQFLIVLILIPAVLFGVITLLASLPSMISDKGYEPGQAWRSEAEWFGGPSVAAGKSTAEIEAGSGQGGTSGTW